MSYVRIGFVFLDHECSTDVLELHNGSHPIEWTASFPITRDSENQRILGRMLNTTRSNRNADRVTITVYSVDDGDTSTTCGSLSVDLNDIVDAGDDMMHRKVPIEDGSEREIGSLVVAVIGYETLAAVCGQSHDDVFGSVY